MAIGRRIQHAADGVYKRMGRCLSSSKQPLYTMNRPHTELLGLLRRHPNKKRKTRYEGFGFSPISSYLKRQMSARFHRQPKHHRRIDLTSLPDVL